MEIEISFNFHNFEEFFEKQKREFIEIAEKHTGEKIDGKEPLLPIDTVKYIAQVFWDEFWIKYF